MSKETAVRFPLSSEKAYKVAVVRSLHRQTTCGMSTSNLWLKCEPVCLKLFGTFCFNHPEVTLPVNKALFHLLFEGVYSGSP